MNYKGKKYCDNCFSTIKAEPCPSCGYKKSKYKAEFGILPVGTLLSDRFTVGQALGRGGFGVTYKAFDMLTGNLVAIKEYYPSGLVHRDSGTKEVTVTDNKNTESFETGAEKFYEEAKTVSKFNGNPNIVGVHEFFYENNTVYYVMEYLAGKDLKKYIAENGGKLSEGQLVFVARNLIDALIITHSLDVLHRDISPDNIFVTDSGEIKLIDFGAARQVIAEQSKSLSVILKQGFAPLEQYQRRGKQGPWTDVYALGASFFYALTGTVMDDATERIDHEDIGEASDYGVDESLWAIIRKCVAIKPEERYCSMLELKEAFKQLSIEAVPLVAAKEPQIGVTMAIPEECASIGETVAVSENDIGQTVAVTDAIGQTVAVSEETVSEKKEVKTESVADTKKKILAFIKSKKGVVTMASAAAIVVAVVLAIAIPSGIQRRAGASGNNAGNNPINVGLLESEKDSQTESVSQEESLKPTEEETETTKETEKESEKETTKEPEKETTKEPEKETTKEPEKKPEKETTKEPEKETTKEPEKETPKEPTVEKVTNKKYTATNPLGGNSIKGKYTGEWKDGKPNGQGTLVELTEAGQNICVKLKGTWENGVLKGKGKMLEVYYIPDDYTPDWGDYWGDFNCVMIYEGTFKNGKFDGTVQCYEASDGRLLGGGYKYKATYSKGEFVTGGATEDKDWDLKYHF